MGVTIIDVAREAATSKSTVSNVLHGDPHVAGDTRARVLDAVDRLGYRPNRAAQSLVRGTTHSIGIVVSDLLNPFYPRLIQRIEQTAKALGYATVLVEAEFDVPDRIADAERLLAGLVDGVLFAASWGAPDSVRRLQARGVPFAVVTSRPSRAEVDHAVVDDRGGGRLAVDHLLSLGHRRIAHVMGAEHDSSTEDRLAGYEDALAAAGLPPDPALVVRATRRDDRSLAADAAVDELLGLRRPPTAIFCGNDAIAVLALARLETRGALVPGDVSIVGFDDVPLAAHPRFSLTTVAQPVDEIAGRATAWLVRRARDRESVDPLRLFLPARLIVRGSTCRVPAGRVERDGANGGERDAARV